MWKLNDQHLSSSIERKVYNLKWKRNILTYLHIELYPGWNSSSWTCTDSWDEKQVQQLEKHCGLESPHKRMLSFMFHT